MKIRFNYPAPDGAVFASDAFEDSLGRPVPFSGTGSLVVPGEGRLSAYTVAEDGRSAELELDIDGSAPVSDPLRGVTVDDSAR